MYKKLHLQYLCIFVYSLYNIIIYLNTSNANNTGEWGLKIVWIVSLKKHRF